MAAVGNRAADPRSVGLVGTFQPPPANLPRGARQVPIVRGKRQCPAEARQAQPTRPSRGIEDRKAQQNQNVATPAQRRAARPPSGPRRDLDAKATAWKVLGEVGITSLADPFINGESFSGIGRCGGLVNAYREAANKRAQDQACASDHRLIYRTITRALEGLRLATEDGKATRTSLLQVIRQALEPRFEGQRVEDFVLDSREVETAKRLGIEVREVRNDRGEVEGSRMVSLIDQVPAGRPFAPEISAALQYVSNIRPRWDRKLCWRVCAAAVFLTGLDRRDYTAIEKSFRDGARRMTAGR